MNWVQDEESIRKGMVVSNSSTAINSSNLGFQVSTISFPLNDFSIVLSFWFDHVTIDV